MPISDFWQNSLGKDASRPQIFECCSVAISLSSPAAQTVHLMFPGNLFCKEIISGVLQIRLLVSPVAGPSPHGPA
ncbi:MAG: hypothetical protein FRX49_12198 [Trebouxia sp. A1-2]|nr:MAG: hypothetical protein FRX49_12198 [Trebouxia sp. A1-2]